MLDVLHRHGLFANLKKYQFYKNEICFLNYIVSAQKVKIKDKYIKIIKNWPKLTLITDIQVSIRFANFYWRFIQSFNRIAALLISILKIARLLNLASKAFRANNNKVVRAGNNRINKTIVSSLKNNKFEN